MAEVGFGVVGVGTWGQQHARVYSRTRGARLVAVCDKDAARAREIAERSGGATVCTDFRELFADKDVAAVSIVLPDFMHRDAVIAAAEAGKHILVEKPLATTEEDCRAMIDAARRNGVHLFVDFHNRWNPMLHALKQAIDDGEMGMPQMIHYRLNDTVFVPTQMLKWAGQSSVAWFLASHCLDTMLWLLSSRTGGDTIEKLHCVTRSRVLREQHNVDTPDFYLTTLEWKSGLVAQMENSWIFPESSPSIVDHRVEFIGSKGAMFINGSHHAAGHKMTDRSRYVDALVSPVIHGEPTGYGAESIRHFVSCVLDRRKPMVDGIDGLAVTRVILKMEQSARTGKPVQVGPLFE